MTTKSPLPVSRNSIEARRSSALALVETAFLASTGSLIWLIDYYFPFGPFLRLFFPLPIALVYLRWTKREALMATAVSGLLLSVLMGPARSVLFLIPYGMQGFTLGLLWKRGARWWVSTAIATIFGTFGVVFKIWLLSVFLNQDLWTYFTVQMTELLNWGLEQLGMFVQPSLAFVQWAAMATIVINSAVYVLVVHLLALLLLDRLGNPIPRPPAWIQVLLDLDYDEASEPARADCDKPDGDEESDDEFDF